MEIAHPLEAGRAHPVLEDRQLSTGWSSRADVLRSAVPLRGEETAMEATSHIPGSEPGLSMFSAQARELVKGKHVTIPAGKIRVAYRTGKGGGVGTMYQAWIEDFLESKLAGKYRGKVALIFTSPPFPLNRKKNYGNFQGDDYLTWLGRLAPKLRDLLTPDGSIVIEVGNAWEAGSPVMATLPLEALLKFKSSGELKLCQQFVGYNTARLPAPIEWVNVRRIRVKDAFTNIWWMSPVEYPKASNRRVLVPYSESMKELIRTGKYNAGRRPSEYVIGKKSFSKDNGGAIPPSVIQVAPDGRETPHNVLEFANTSASDPYQNRVVKGRDLQEHLERKHPARMHPSIADFFIRMLTEEGDLVLDPFAGSNTTGANAQRLGRRWVAVEPNRSYIRGSLGWFQRKKQSPVRGGPTLTSTGRPA